MKHTTRFLLCISLLGHLTIAQAQEVVKDYDDKIMKPFKKNHFLTIFSLLLLLILVSCNPTLYLIKGRGLCGMNDNSVKAFSGYTLCFETDINIVPKIDRNYYIQFIREHPHSRVTGFARTELENIDWVNSNSVGTIQAYETYIKEHSGEKRTDIAKTKIILLNDFEQAKQYNSLEEWIKVMNNSKIDYKTIYFMDEYDNQIRLFKDKISDFLLEGNCNIIININEALLDYEGINSRDKELVKRRLVSIILSSIGGSMNIYNQYILNKQSHYSIVLDYREYICSRAETAPREGNNWFGSTYQLKDVPCAELQISLKSNNQQIANIRIKDIAPINIIYKPVKDPITIHLYGPGEAPSKPPIRRYSAKDFIFDINGWRLLEKLSYSPFIFEVSK